jgi:Raf kinase inhibitor-like YbhB/YbcL family protein
MAFRIRVLAFDQGETIPVRYTGEGENVSPAVEWDGVPSGTKSLALIVDDPDAPGGTWTHWLMWDIPAAEHGLAEAYLPHRLGTSGVNDFGNEGYGGPMPPKGHGPHRYFFKLIAIDTPRLLLHGGLKRWDLDKALRGHIIDEAWTMGTFERQ